MRAAFVFTFLLFSMVTYAQRNCVFTEYANRHPFTPSKPSTSMNVIPPRDTVPGEIITIPVVIHILFKNPQFNISDEQVLSQLRVLNEDFRKLNADAVNVPAAFQSRAADARIMFCLAQVDPSGRPTKGIVRKQTNVDPFLGDDAMKFSAAGGDDAWDTKRYLNIWVCSLFGRTLGYATIPGSPEEKDGVVINYDVFGTTGLVRPPFNKGRTATHEVAHWLGLKHIWGDENCGSDDVDDTPTQRSYNFNCPSFPHISTCSPDANGDMFMNFMDLTDDACMNMFTYGQKNKMRSTFALNAPRNAFLNSYACDSTLATGAPLPDTIITYKSEPLVMIYPNPVQNRLTVKGKDGFLLQGSTFTVYSIQGVKLKQQLMTDENTLIDMSAFTTGMYLLEIKKGQQKKVLKVMKQ